MLYGDTAAFRYLQLIKPCSNALPALRGSAMAFLEQASQGDRRLPWRITACDYIAKLMQSAFQKMCSSDYSPACTSEIITSEDKQHYLLSMESAGDTSLAEWLRSYDGKKISAELLKQFAAVQIFCMLIGQLDGNTNNYLLTSNKNNSGFTLKAIDFGLTFPSFNTIGDKTDVEKRAALALYNTALTSLGYDYPTANTFAKGAASRMVRVFSSPPPVTHDIYNALTDFLSDENRSGMLLKLQELNFLGNEIKAFAERFDCLRNYYVKEASPYSDEQYVENFKKGTVFNVNNFFLTRLVARKGVL
jgi:hypothetical protein